MATELYVYANGRAHPLDIGGGLQADFFNFRIEDGNLVLCWTGQEPAAEFSINEDGYLEVSF